MKHGLTKAEKAAGFDEIKAESWRNHSAMQALYEGKVRWSRWVKEVDSPGKYRVGVFGEMDANGGTCIVAFEYPEQRAQISVYNWDNFQQTVRDSNSATEWNRIMSHCIYDRKVAS